MYFDSVQQSLGVLEHMSEHANEYCVNECCVSEYYVDKYKHAGTRGHKAVVYISIVYVHAPNSNSASVKCPL